MTQHAILGASKAHRWMACPGSLLLEAGAGDAGSEFAREGTAAHEAAAIILNGGNVSVGQEVAGWEVDEEMLGYVEEYADQIEAIRSIAAYSFVEVPLRIQHLTHERDAESTADFVAVAAHPTGGYELIVVDLKYGMGKIVHAEDNKQLAVYVLGALAWLMQEHPEIATQVRGARGIIAQPRKGGFRETRMTLVDIDWWRVQIMEAANRARAVIAGGTPEGNLLPGEEQCSFCPAKATCGARFKWLSSVQHLEHDDPAELRAMLAKYRALAAVGRIDAATVEEAREIRILADAIAPAAKQAGDILFAALNEGQVVPGFKLALGREGNTKWSVELEDIVLATGADVEEITKRSLLSPTQLKKAWGQKSEKWGKVTGYTFRSPAKLSLKRDFEAGEAQTSSIEEAFK
jgi:hypothetical protein